MSNLAVLESKKNAILDALASGGDDREIAAQLGTTAQAVRVIRKGVERVRRMGSASLPAAEPTAVEDATTDVSATGMSTDGLSAVPSGAGEVPWGGRYVAIDGANVAGWGRRKGEPRLAQVLALCRWLSDHGVRFTCWFDAGFRWAVKGFSESDSAVLERVLKAEPGVFKQSPAGGGADGETIKADPFVLRDAAGVPGGLVVSNDLYRTEAEKDSEAFGWTQREPDRFIRGAVAGNGDLLLGANGEVRIPVADDASRYI